MRPDSEPQVEILFIADNCQLKKEKILKIFYSALKRVKNTQCVNTTHSKNTHPQNIKKEVRK